MSMVLLIVSIIFITVLVLQSEKFVLANKELDYYQKTYLSKSGATMLWRGSNGKVLSYNLHSIDGGNSWFVVQSQGQSLKVLGDVETVYPGLMKHLEGMDALTERVKQNKLLDFHNSNDVNLLKNIGLYVITQK